MPIYVELVFYIFKGDVIEVVFNDIVEELCFPYTRRKKNTVIRAKGLKKSGSEPPTCC